MPTRPHRQAPCRRYGRGGWLPSRRTRTAEAAAHDRAYAGRLPALDAQLAALVVALDAYLGELRAGRRTFFAHDPLKLYVAPADLTRGDGNHPG